MICRYVAPEYAENGILSVRTDVYAFGIVLIQLISGRKVFDVEDDIQGRSLREWVSINSIVRIVTVRTKEVIMRMDSLYF